MHKPLRIAASAASFLSLLALGATPGIALAADTQAPVVNAVTPTTAVAGVAKTFSAIVSDDVGVTACTMSFIGDVIPDKPMTISSNRASISLTQTAGKKTVLVQCSDAAGHVTVGPTTEITVTADTASPVLGSLSPSTATSNLAQTYSVSYSDNVGVASCSIAFIGENMADAAMTLNNGTASISLSLGTGTHNLQAMCTDASGNIGTASLQAVTVSPLIIPNLGDKTAPTVGQITQNGATLNLQTTLSASYSDNVGVSSCNLFVNGNDAGAMNLSGGIASKNYTFNAAGAQTVVAKCSDAAGNLGTGASQTVQVSNLQLNLPNLGDKTAPTVGQIAQNAATVGVQTTLTASYSDNVSVSGCTLSVNGSDAGAMDISNGTASKNYTFNAAGAQTVVAKCSDSAGNIGTGSTQTIQVTALANNNPLPPAQQNPNAPAMGTLIKLICPGAVSSDHPCKAVYYYGKDGKRHAFPNERVFFTWFTNFDGVVEVKDSVMNGIGLGKNVLYRPGTKMVKFTTIPNVYAVGLHGSLHWVTTEAIAISLYGSDWNKKIDDLSDALFTNYSFGADIKAVSDFSVSGQKDSAPTIDANF